MQRHHHHLCGECSKQDLKDRREKRKIKNKDRDPYDGTPKRCPRCKDTLPRTNKYWLRGASQPDGLHHYCLECHALDALRRQAVVIGHNLLTPEGFNGKDVRELKVRQGNRCFVCDLPENGKRMVLDHNHTTGRIRGLVHERCNQMLSWLDMMWNQYPEKRSWLFENPHYRQVLCEPPARYLYDSPET